MKRYLLCFSVLLLLSFFGKAQTPTWATDIAPILYANCTKCHHTGGAGHFSLMTFSDAYTYGFSMASDVSNKIMPPWPPDQNYKHFAHERVISQTEIDAINSWVTAGRPMGDITQAPAQPTYSNGSQLGTVNLTVKTPDYSPTGTTDVYRNFVLPSGLLQSKYITAFEVIPGDAHLVHHVLIFSDTTGVPAQLDAADAGPGYTNAGGTGSLASKLIGGFTPGASPYYTPVGTGFRLPANTNIIVQVHYPQGASGTDSTRINFKLSSTAVREITVYPLVNHLQNINAQINIPANTTRTYYEQYNMPSGNWTFLSAFPHMHLIGRSIECFATTTIPNDTIRFVNVPNWDFNWQDTYVFPNAVKVPGGTGNSIKARAFYDNTANNPFNPNNPLAAVHAGEATTDEMMMVFFGFMPYVTGDENLIIDRRVIPQGATTFCNGQQVVLKTIEGTGYTYQWYKNGTSISGANSFAYSATQAGNYHVLISLGPNSAYSDTIPVTVSAAPTAAITSALNSFCPGGSITLNATTGTGYTYQWLNNATPITNATAASYTATAAGSYTLQVYNGCYALSTAKTITAASAPSNAVMTIGSPTFCVGANVTLSAPAGLTYHWSNNATSQNIVLTQSGNYLVTVTGANNCTAVSTPITVTANALPSATITPSGITTFCAGGNVTLSAPALLSYHWSGGQTSSSIQVTQTGDYALTVTDANTCRASAAAVHVTVNTNPSAAVNASGSTTFCAGGTVSLSAPAGLTYHWSNNAASQTIAATQTGNYLVTVTGSNSCTAVSTPIAVTVNPLPSSTITPSGLTTFCSGGSVTLSAPASLSYHWSGGQTSSSIQVTQTGDYALTVTDANTCSASAAAVHVTVHSTPSVSITASGSTEFCNGGSVVLNATNAAAYSWSDGAVASSSTINTSGTVSVTITDANSCTNTTSQIVTEYPAVDNTITTDRPTTICPGEQVNLSAAAGFSYNWSNSATGQSIAVSANGTFAVTVTDSHSCSAVSAPVTITVSNNAVASITPSGSTNLCSGGSVQLTASSGDVYLWSNGDTSQTIAVSSTGSFSVVVTTSGTCIAVSDTTEVVLNTNPIVTLSGNADTVCSSAGAIQLTGGNPPSGTFSGNAVSGSLFDASTAAPGSNLITYSYTDNNGCSSLATETIEVEVCSGISTLSENSIRIQPNPNNGTFEIYLDGNNSSNAEAKVFDASGKLVYNNVLVESSSTISLGEVSSGIYLLQVKTATGTFRRKVVIGN